MASCHYLIPADGPQIVEEILAHIPRIHYVIDTQLSLNAFRTCAVKKSSSISTTPLHHDTPETTGGAVDVHLGNGQGQPGRSGGHGRAAAIRGARQVGTVSLAHSNH